jgi:hypothetical protein
MAPSILTTPALAIAERGEDARTMTMARSDDAGKRWRVKRKDAVKGGPWAQRAATISDNQNGEGERERGREGERESKCRVSEEVVEKVSSE